MVKIDDVLISGTYDSGIVLECKICHEEIQEFAGYFDAPPVELVEVIGSVRNHECVRVQ